MEQQPRTFAILVGTSDFPEDDTLRPIPNVAVNLREWEKVLRDESFIGLPKERIFKIYNQSRRETLKELRRAAEKANKPTDRLIIYFAGHGVYASNYEFCLAAYDTDIEDIDITGIPGRTFRDTVQQNTSAKSIVFVMDCCYSGNFSENMGDANTAIQQELKKSGNYILTATDKDSPAKFDPDRPDTPTAFTGFLLEGIRQGIAGKGDLLSFEDLKDYTVVRARESRNPIPEATAHKDGNTLKFFKNKAAKSEAQKEAEAWETAKAQGDVQAYRTFLRKFPKTPHFDEAIDRIADLEEARAWEKAKKAHTVSAYRNFLRKHPSGSHSEEAQEAQRKLILEETVPDPKPTPKTDLKPPKKEEGEKRPLPWWPFAAVGGLLLVFVGYWFFPKEADAWKETQKAATPKALQGFLDEYPNGKFAKTAHQKLDSLASLAFTEAQSTHTQEAYEAFQKDFYRKPYFLWADSAIDKMQWEATTATNTAVAYQQYKQDRPNSYLLPQADSALKAIEVAQQEDYTRDQAAFEEAQSQNTRAGYKKYLDAFPQGRYAAKAEKQYKALKPKLHPEVQKLVDNLVYVKGGTFQMGSNSGDSDEKPVHSVTLSDYYIGKFEVTQAQWKAVMGTTVRQQRDKANKSWPLRGEGGSNPMYYVSWNEAQQFLKKLRQLTGRNFTLPTEAQWEYAARGGKKSKGYKYAGSSSIDNVAWYGDNSSNKTHPVGRKAPNELGLYDMSGNVWEWCADWYDKDYYKNSPSENPTGPSSGESRVLRGGSWNVDAQVCRVAFRYHFAAAYRSSNFGFRCAVSP